MENVEALAAVQAQQNSYSISVADVEQLLAPVRGTTFATIAYVTKVATAAAHKAMHISKVTIASVQLFNNLQAYTNAYENAVKRSAAKIAGNDAQAVAAFKSQDNYFEHTQCYSVVKHKTDEKFYLFSIYNNAESAYVIDNKVVDKADIVQYLTKSAAAALFSDGTVHNVTNDITHSVVVRTVKLQNIVSITAQKQTLLV
jgi:IMP cyclohydrolase